MKPPGNRIWLHQLIIVAVAGVALLTNLGATRLWDQDEAYFAGAAWEMHARGDWVTPYFNQQLFAHKPPLMYWLMIGGYELFGRNEFAARIGSALLGVATGVLVYHMGRRLFSPTAGLWAALAIVTCLMFDVVARAATPDCHLVFFTGLALYLFLRYCPEARLAAGGEQVEATNPTTNRLRSYGAWTLVYAAMGVAVLVKGPIGVLLPSCVMGLYLMLTSTPRRRTGGDAVTRDAATGDGLTCDASTGTALAESVATWKSHLLEVLRRLSPLSFVRAAWKMKPWLLVGVVLLVAGPWFLLVHLRTGGEFTHEFFWKHHVERFLEPLDNHQGPWWYYLPAMLAGFFPWSIFAVPTALELVRRIRGGGRGARACLLLVCWVAVFVVFFSKASTKLPNYVLPAYPALALAVGCYLERWLRAGQAGEIFGTRCALAVLALSGLLLTLSRAVASVPVVGGQSLLAALDASPQLEHDLTWVAWLGVVPLAGAALCLAFDMLHRRRWVLPALALTALTFVTGALAGVALRIDRHQLSQSIAQAIHDNQHGDAPRVAQYGFFRPSLVYYTAGRLEACRSPDDVAGFLAAGDDRFVVMPQEKYAELHPLLPRGVVVVSRQARFPKRGEIVVVAAAPRRVARQPAPSRR